MSFWQDSFETFYPSCQIAWPWNYGGLSSFDASNPAPKPIEVRTPAPNLNNWPAKSNAQRARPKQSAPPLNVNQIHLGPKQNPVQGQPENINNLGYISNSIQNLFSEKMDWAYES